eukprot:TRINITY_DN533_c0_g1_i4.p1 TRINITY_DN533_c0_g1~~TRINITY_DN533_c0_g1_i4.p1  ORF type:complete len:105 (-),score=17.31 TRINITY_DN533_c0_g1_i4:535-849(-)
MLNEQQEREVYSFAGLGNISGVNFCAAFMLPLIFIFPLHHINVEGDCTSIPKIIKYNICFSNLGPVIRQRAMYLMKASWGFIFPKAMAMKSPSTKEKAASGFPS